MSLCQNISAIRWQNKWICSFLVSTLIHYAVFMSNSQVNNLNTETTTTVLLGIIRRGQICTFVQVWTILPLKFARFDPWIGFCLVFYYEVYILSECGIRWHQKVNYFFSPVAIRTTDTFDSVPWWICLMFLIMANKLEYRYLKAFQCATCCADSCHISQVVIYRNIENYVTQLSLW